MLTLRYKTNPSVSLPNMSLLLSSLQHSVHDLHCLFDCHSNTALILGPCPWVIGFYHEQGILSVCAAFQAACKPQYACLYSCQVPSPAPGRLLGAPPVGDCYSDTPNRESASHLLPNVSGLHHFPDVLLLWATSYLHIGVRHVLALCCRFCGFLMVRWSLSPSFSLISSIRRGRSSANICSMELKCIQVETVSVWKSWFSHVAFLDALDVGVKVSAINYSKISYCLKASTDWW